MSEEYTCDKCVNAAIDNEYFLLVKGVPITTKVILCTSDIVKDKYYNRFIRQKKVHIDATNEIPPLIGQAHDYCRGIYFKASDKSILDKNDEDDDF